MTVLAKLLASESDSMGYITYVFECLDDNIIRQTKYIMCTRFPNWDHRKIEIGEVGFLNFFEVRAGIDKWFDGTKFVPYRYSNIQFIKFIERPTKKPHKFTMQIQFKK